MTKLWHDHLLSAEMPFWAPFLAKRPNGVPGRLTILGQLIIIERIGFGAIEVSLALWRRLIGSALPAFKAIFPQSSPGYVHPQVIPFDWTRDLMTDMALLRLAGRWPVGEMQSFPLVIKAWRGLSAAGQEAVTMHLGNNGDLAIAAQLAVPFPTIRPEALPFSPRALFMKQFAETAKSQISWDVGNDCRWDFVFGPIGNTICGLTPSPAGDLIMPIWSDVDIIASKSAPVQPREDLIELIAFYYARAQRFAGILEKDINTDCQRFRQIVHLP